MRWKIPWDSAVVMFAIIDQERIWLAVDHHIEA